MSLLWNSVVVVPVVVAAAAYRHETSYSSRPGSNGNYLLHPRCPEEEKLMKRNYLFVSQGALSMKKTTTTKQDDSQ